MTITLTDIAESEKICEAFNEKIEAGFEGLEMDGVDAIKLIGGFSHHARTRLPEMNKLVREMLKIIEELIEEVETVETLSEEMVVYNHIIETGIVAKARRYLETMGRECIT
ncbi:hypothetical protein LCGC14_1126430 [marine sediment metagenome]|uniref:Uncharacterized protein n=1 Tax=marine sediment metagenome TaxID=412755 RepID=A0A0F9M2G5_9ZZZZ